MTPLDDALQRPGLNVMIIDLSRVHFLGFSGILIRRPHPAVARSVEIDLSDTRPRTAARAMRGYPFAGEGEHPSCTCGRSTAHRRIAVSPCASSSTASGGGATVTGPPVRCPRW
jgi:hypothetical protein